MELSCFFYDPQYVGNLISGSSVFSKPNLDIWKFLVHIMLKPSMKDFKHDITSMGGFPDGSEVKASACNVGDLGLIPGSERSLGERKWRPTPVFLTGEFRGQRSLVGSSPWGCKESDMTE